MKTLIYKGRSGWQAESTTEADANGQAWQITTRKSREGVSCSAIQGQVSNSCFSYGMFGAKRLELATEAGICNENKVRSVHAAGLIEFEKQVQTQPEVRPAYVVGVGQIIWTDFIHSTENEKRRVIYEVESAGSYKTVTLDGEQLHTDNRVRPYSEAFGIGVYYNEGETLPLEQVLTLVEQAKRATIARDEAADLAKQAAAEDRARKIEQGKKILSAIPEGVTHIIIAQHEKNESDLMTDYFGSTTTETVYLSWSTHKRDIFSEMRKAAGKFEHTQVYAEAPVKPENADDYWTAPDEHREKYSMGSGYYLAHSIYSGWNVSKTGISTNGGYGVTLETLQIAAAEGRFLCTEAEPVKETANYEPVKVSAGEVQIIDYSEKAVAVVGDTKPIKDLLKDLGGRFNFRLSCGAGWIFPKTKLSEIQAALS